MVKFKSRYILIEMLYQGDKNQPFDSSKIAYVLRMTVEKYFGDVGLGKLSKNLQVKYMNNYTNMVIIRTSKENLKMLWTAIAMISSIDTVCTRMKIIGISGTIKRCEMRANKYLTQWMANYEQNK